MTNKEQKALDKVTRKFDDVEQKVSRLHKKFNELENLYFNYLFPSQKSAKSNAFSPLAFEMVEKSVSTIFANNPRGNYVGMEPGDERSAAILDSLVDYQWNRPGQNMLQKLQNMGRTSMIFGTAFGHIGWKYERKFIEAKKKHITTWDDWYFQDLNIYDCFPDMSAQSPEDMQFFMFDEYKTIDQLKAENTTYKGVKKWENLTELEDKLKADNNSYMSSNTSYRANASRRLGIKSNSNDVGSERIVVRHYFDNDEWITVVPDFGLVLSVKKNPCPEIGIPIVTLRDYDYPGQLYGRGEIEPVKSLIVATNQFLNMRLDNIKLNMAKPLITTPSNLKHQHTWKIQPGGVLIEEAAGALRTLEFPDTTGNTYVQIVNEFKDSIAKSLGSLDFLSRNESQGSRTATEIKAMAGEQNARMRYKEGNLDKMIKDIYIKALQLNQKYLSNERLIRIVGEDAIDTLKKYEGMSETESPTGIMGLEEPKLREVEGTDTAFLSVDPEDIAGMFDYKVEGGSTRALDISNEVQSYTTALNTLAQVKDVLEQQEGVRVAMKPVIEELMLKLGIKNLDRIFLSAEAETEEDNMLNQMNGQQAVGALPSGNPTGMPEPSQLPAMDGVQQVY